MTTTKRGGARKKVRTDDGRGGVRKGAGRPVADIQLDTEHAALLRSIMHYYGLPYSPEDASMFVMANIRQEWAKIDQDVQKEADKEGGIP